MRGNYPLLVEPLFYLRSLVSSLSVLYSRFGFHEGYLRVQGCQGFRGLQGVRALRFGTYGFEGRLCLHA